MTEPIPFTAAEVGIRTGQTAGDWCWLTVAYFDGVSVTMHPDLLARLAAVVEDRALAEIHRTTNCATSRRWGWALDGCAHPWCRLPDEDIRAMANDPTLDRETRDIAAAGPVAWDLKIARDMGALVDCHGMTTDQILAMLDKGWTVHYCGLPGTDHIETIGSKPDPKTGLALHGGGGRSSNAITVGTGDVRSSLGRPPRHLVNPDKLLPELRKFDELVGDTEVPPTLPTGTAVRGDGQTPDE